MGKLKKLKEFYTSLSKNEYFVKVSLVSCKTKSSILKNKALITRPFSFGWQNFAPVTKQI